jgi:hypothetical protein
MPDQSEYINRLVGYTRGQDPIVMQTAAPGILEDLVAGCAAAELSRRPAPEKWSVVEIIAHMADDELVTAWRYRQMLENSGCALAGFDQDKWAALGKYGEWTADEGLQMFRMLRQANLRTLRSLSEVQWECFGIHAERGRMTVRELALHMAGHDINHIEQVRKIVGKPAAISAAQ